MLSHALAALIAGPCIGAAVGLFGVGHSFLLACMFLGSVLGVCFFAVVLGHWALGCVYNREEARERGNGSRFR